MAKKQKVQLTPEEAAAKKIRTSNGWVRFWAIFLAIALTAGIVAFAKMGGPEAEEDVSADAPVAQQQVAPANPATPAPADPAKPADPAAPADPAKPAASPEDTQKALDAVNKATQDAAKLNAYKWDRTCSGSLNMPGGVKRLEPIVAKFANGMTIQQIVENFLGFGEYKFDIDRAAIKGGNRPALPKQAYYYDRYNFVGTQLKADDLSEPATINGNEYTFKLKDCANPTDEVGKSSLRNATTDFVTAADVDYNLQNSTGKLLKLKDSDVQYTNIVVKATLSEDGKLQNMTLSYTMNVNKFDINMLSGSTGKGEVKVTYSDFK